MERCGKRFLAIVAVSFALGGLSRMTQAGEIMDNEKLYKLLRAGITLKVIEDKVNKSVTQFRYDADDIVKMKEEALAGGMTKEDIDGLLLLISAESTKGQKRLRELSVQFINGCVNYDKDEYERKMREILREGRAIVPYLIPFFNEEDEKKRVGVLDAIGRLGDRAAFNDVRLMLIDRHKAVRAQAAQALAKLADEKTIDVLVEALQQRRGEMIDGVCLALGYLKDPKATPHLTKILMLSTNEDDRVAAAFALGMMRTREPETVTALLDAVLDPVSPMVRYRSAEALSLIGEPRVIAYVVRAFQRHAGEGRAALIGVLARFKYYEAIEFLIEQTNNDAPEIRKAANEALEISTGESFSDYDAWLTWWQQHQVRPDWQRIQDKVSASPEPKESVPQEK